MPSFSRNLKAVLFNVKTRGPMVLYHSPENQFRSELPWIKIIKDQRNTLTSGACISPCTHLVYYRYKLSIVSE